MPNDTISTCVNLSDANKPDATPSPSPRLAHLMHISTLHAHPSVDRPLSTLSPKCTSTLSCSKAAPPTGRFPTQAGVLIHVMDGGLQQAHPWLQNGRPYLSASLVHLRKWLVTSGPHGKFTGLYGRRALGEINDGSEFSVSAAPGSTTEAKAPGSVPAAPESAYRHRGRRLGQSQAERDGGEATHSKGAVFGRALGGKQLTALVISPLSKLVCSYPQDSGTLSWTKHKTGLPGCGETIHVTHLQ